MGVRVPMASKCGSSVTWIPSLWHEVLTEVVEQCGFNQHGAFPDLGSLVLISFEHDNVHIYPDVVVALDFWSEPRWLVSVGLQSLGFRLCGMKSLQRLLSSVAS